MNNGKYIDMIGQLVISKAGHDKDLVYVIIAEEGDFVYLSDGRLKPPQKPKKKRRKHMQPTRRTVDAALLDRLAKGEAVEPEAIRYAIKQYQKE